MRKSYLLMGMVFIITGSLQAQTVLYVENFGTTASFPSGWSSSNTTNGWNMTTGSQSSGYTGASGGANVIFNNTGTAGNTHTLTYSNSLSTAGYKTITILWAARSSATFSQAVNFQWSSNGTTWNQVSFTNVTSNNVWAFVNGGTRIPLPAEAEEQPELMLRWSITVNNSGTYRIDDFSIQGFLTTLPVNFGMIRTSRQSAGVKLEWTNLTETDVNYYAVERSVDGRQFSSIGQLKARLNNGDRADYNFTDVSPFNGSNYYRIRSEEYSGHIVYSTIVKLATRVSGLNITIYPNPVRDRQVSWHANDLPQGRYGICLYNAVGQQVYLKSLIHNGGQVAENMALVSAVKPGQYYLQIINEELNITRVFLVQ
jgi:hypothetical protein